MTYQNAALSAADVEKEFSTLRHETEFASLCNDLVWAIARRDVPSLPSFTERTSAKNYGTDASWDIECGAELLDSPLLGPGWNVYQYKQRDAFSDRGRNAVITHLTRSLRGELKKLYETTGRRPARYVLFTNLDLLHGQKEVQVRQEEAKANADVAAKKSTKRTRRKRSTSLDVALREAIMEGYDAPEDVIVSIVGAAELKSFLNALPHLEGIYFGHSRFASWQQSWATHVAESPVDGGAGMPPADIVGHEEPLVRLCAAPPSTL